MPWSRTATFSPARGLPGKRAGRDVSISCGRGLAVAQVRMTSWRPWAGSRAKLRKPKPASLQWLNCCAAGIPPQRRSPCGLTSRFRASKATWFSLSFPVRSVASRVDDSRCDLELGILSNPPGTDNQAQDPHRTLDGDRLPLVHPIRLDVRSLRRGRAKARHNTNYKKNTT